MNKIIWPISLAYRSILEILFSDQEIKYIVWGFEVSKSPDPDRYNFFFIRKCWDFMKSGIIKFVKYFHRNLKLNKSMTSSFLALIPKNPNPQGIEDFRTICLVGCLKKTISKILASRIKRVISSLITPARPLSSQVDTC